MSSKEKKRSMLWLLFALGAMLAWGIYGPILHTGQVKLGNPMKALLCVGGAYFLLGVLVPVLQLQSSGGMGSFDRAGTISASLGGALGAIGAICIIFAFRNGGVPNYVMPIVFGGAPLINVLFTMYLHPPETKVNPLLWLGYVITAGGAAMVFYFKPKG
jgi:drug/metabolite transporter (DMT)-like permease